MRVLKKNHFERAKSEKTLLGNQGESPTSASFRKWYLVHPCVLETLLVSVSVAGDCAASIYPISRDEFHTAATRGAYDAAKPFGFFPVPECTFFV